MDVALRMGYTRIEAEAGGARAGDIIALKMNGGERAIRLHRKSKTAAKKMQSKYTASNCLA